MMVIVGEPVVVSGMTVPAIAFAYDDANDSVVLESAMTQYAVLIVNGDGNALPIPDTVRYTTCPVVSVFAAVVRTLPDAVNVKVENVVPEIGTCKGVPSFDGRPAPIPNVVLE